MNIAICDDVYQDKRYLFNSLSSFCATNYLDAAITEYDSGEALVERFAKGMFDIIFLDIYMNGLSGIDTAQKIRAIDQECLLVFVTSSNEYAVEGFAVNALHYLIKPISAEKLAEVFARCQKILDAAQYLEVMSERLLVKIPVNSIQYIEVYNKTCFIHKDLGVIKTNLTLEEIEKQLDKRIFSHCHRSYIVNMRYIASVDDKDFILQSGSLVPIRQSEKQVIKQTYMNFLFSVARGEHHVC